MGEKELGKLQIDFLSTVQYTRRQLVLLVVCGYCGIQIWWKLISLLIRSKRFMWKLRYIPLIFLGYFLRFRQVLEAKTKAFCGIICLK